MSRHRRVAIVLALAACSADSTATTAGLSAEAGSDGGSSGTPAESSSGTGSVDGSSSTAASSSGSDGADASTSSADDGPLLDVGSDDPPPGCAAAAEQYIYLLEANTGALHRYDPDANTVAGLGTPQCPGAYVPMALTIDRSGTLWALMSDAEGTRIIYTIDPETLDCADTGFVDPFVDGYTVAGGIAFVADAPDSAEESLYVAIIEGGLNPATPLTLGKIDEMTMDLSYVGELAIVGNGYYQIADLVGTGESRLFGFFPGDTAVMTEIDEEAVTLVVEQPLGFGVGSPWAFTQWKGRLWLFSPGDVSGSSEVRAYDLAADMLETIEPDLGVLVVGAAVSTCAPYEPEG